MSTATAIPASSASTNPTPAHTINIRKVNLDAVPPNPFPEMAVGDTVRYVSNDGEVTIEFEGPSPYRLDDVPGTKVSGGVIVTVVSKSTGRGLKDDAFQCHCFLTLPGGQVIGWGPGSSISGADHHVKKP
jgi:hypothetical protein